MIVYSYYEAKKSSPFDVENLQAFINKLDILEAIQESRERLVSLHDQRSTTTASPK